MGFLDDIRPTPDQMVRDHLLGNSRRLFMHMCQQYAEMYDAIWANPLGLTPQEVSDALGTDAAEFVAGAYALYDTINAIKPGTLDLPPQQQITINPDGTVTLTPFPPSPSSSEPSLGSLTDADLSGLTDEQLSELGD